MYVKYFHFIIRYKKIKIIFNKNIKYIRIDNEKEFINSNFKKFFKSIVSFIKIPLLIVLNKMEEFRDFMVR